jgi:hypothetical protein
MTSYGPLRGSRVLIAQQTSMPSDPNTYCTATCPKTYGCMIGDTRVNDRLTFPARSSLVGSLSTVVNRAVLLIQQDTHAGS